jgi:colanic acid/amylovoran biosynthesis glycosyltransferase
LDSARAPDGAPRGTYTCGGASRLRRLPNSDVDTRQVLHLTQELGNLTDRWIDLQCRSGERYRGRLAGVQVAPGERRRPYWVVLGDRIDRRLAYKGLNKSGGLSTAWLAGAFRDNPPDLLHIHYGILASQHRWLARALRRPFAASFYGFDATERRFTESRLWRARYARLFRDTSAIIVEGPAMAARVAALGGPEDKLAVVRLPADLESVARTRARKSDDFLVAVAGRFIPKKGFDTAIRAFAKALRGRADARLLVIGGGELEGEYRRIAAEERIESQVHWAGRLPFDDFMAAVSSSHVGLYPSRAAPNGDSEGGAPVTLIEAQGAGVPSIVSDHDDLPFVAAPGGAIVLAPQAVADWADALRMLYDDPGTLARMSRVAEDFVARRHSPSTNARAREEVYDRIVAA